MYLQMSVSCAIASLPGLFLRRSGARASFAVFIAVFGQRANDGMLSAYAAVRICAENGGNTGAQRQTVKGQNSAGQQLPNTQQEFDRFQCLKIPDDACHSAKHSGL